MANQNMNLSGISAERDDDRPRQLHVRIDRTLSSLARLRSNITTELGETIPSKYDGLIDSLAISCGETRDSIIHVLTAEKAMVVRLETMLSRVATALKEATEQLQEVDKSLGRHLAQIG
ncbi:MAG: hypothetical protein FWD25_11275 [Clostridia bacterium]|nr:hypothetical protein [Clostridia bacterium]